MKQPNTQLGLSATPFAMGRRELLRFGLAGLGGLSLPGLLNLRSQAAQVNSKQGGDSAHSASHPKALIVIWLQGGASHLETYDPKPLAASDFRGPYAPIRTNTPGVDICELLPEHAKVADKFTLLRSMVHSGFCHQQGTQQLFTGHPVRVLRNKPENPDLMSITHRMRSGPVRTIPNYVGLPPISYAGSAFLGPAYEPFKIYGDPNSPDFNVPNVGMKDTTAATRLRGRIELRKKLDLFRRDVDDLGEMKALDTFEAQAWQMLTNAKAKEAFDISQEDEKTRDRYGRNRWGQQCLLARRLVESGVELITTQFSGSLCGRVGNWDDHAVNHNVFEALKLRCPYYDRAVSALIEDIYERGLDRRVMVVVTGEFGRTPRISYKASTGGGIGSAAKGTTQPGRDHWPRATSMLFAGGGIETGQVIGATDIRGEDATDRVVGRGDFLATLYHHLGINPNNIAFKNFTGRPVPILPEGGKPIAELVGS